MLEEKWEQFAAEYVGYFADSENASMEQWRVAVSPVDLAVGRVSLNETELESEPAQLAV